MKALALFLLLCWLAGLAIGTAYTGDAPTINENGCAGLKAAPHRAECAALCADIR